MLEQEPVHSHVTLNGERYLWKQPELLTVEAHGRLGLVNCDAPLAFAAEARGIPLTVGEFRSALRFYPIVFTDPDNLFPVAAVGLAEERNLFMDREGHWADRTYIPAYVRSHPFGLAPASDDRFALIIDRASQTVSDQPDFPFFVEGQPSETVRKAVEFCQKFEEEVARTRAFCAKLKELDLLVPQRVRREKDGEEVVRYYAVSAEKLAELPDDTVASLHREGYLAAIFAHLFSFEQWHELFWRESR